MDNPSLTMPFDDDTDGAAPKDRRRTVVAVAALAVTALGAGGYLLLGTGPDAAVDAAAAAPAAAPAPAVASPSPSPVEPVTRSAGTVGRSARNPFQVLYVAPAEGGTGAAPDAAAGGTGADPDGGASPALPDGAPVPVGPVPDEGSIALPVPAEGGGQALQQLVLTGVQGADGSRSAVFTLDGVRTTVAVGGSFGSGDALLLLSLQEGPDQGQWTAVVQLGQGDPFDVVTGQPVSVA